mmetsp:Transcript_4961/g.13935  ORF Transcript_4961/g.13935 Transcript_4961/m.13935 type:complete len:309 (+) Transcript_4961:2400-3326(+)
MSGMRRRYGTRLLRPRVTLLWSMVSPCSLASLNVACGCTARTFSRNASASATRPVQSRANSSCSTVSPSRARCKKSAPDASSSSATSKRAASHTMCPALLEVSGSTTSQYEGDCSMNSRRCAVFPSRAACSHPFRSSHSSSLKGDTLATWGATWCSARSRQRFVRTPPRSTSSFVLPATIWRTLRPSSSYVIKPASATSSRGYTCSPSAECATTKPRGPVSALRTPRRKSWRVCHLRVRPPRMRMRPTNRYSGWKKARSWYLRIMCCLRSSGEVEASGRDGDTVNSQTQLTAVLLQRSRWARMSVALG